MVCEDIFNKSNEVKATGKDLEVSNIFEREHFPSP